VIDVVTAMDAPNLFAPWFPGASWDGWRTVLRAAFGLRMSKTERRFFRSIAERDPPSRQVKECHFIVGRGGGKDSIASLIAAHAAALFDPKGKLRPGERAMAMLLACDRDQARIALRFIRSYFTDIPPLAAMVVRDTANGFELSNGVDVAVATSSYRSVRGRSILLCIMDEVAFWRSEESANPDEEVYAAVKPGLARVPGSMLVGISSPYAQRGLLYRKFRKHFGQAGDEVLVVRAPTLTMNPTLDRAVIEQALAEDPAKARAEWLAEFRTDVESYVSVEVIEAAIAPGRHELPPASGVTYVAFTDPSGGSADSMTLAICHQDRVTKRVVLDAVRERRPPFAPDGVVNEFAELLRSYGVRKVSGDRFAGEWPRERFRFHGIEYLVAEKPKSDIYRDVLATLNSGRAELLDLPRLAAQLCGLERRTARGGRDSIDHAPGGHDDVANCVCGAIELALSRRPPMVITPEIIAKLRSLPPRKPFRGRHSAGWDGSYAIGPNGQVF
jgi:hypothetical protein